MPLPLATLASTFSADVRDIPCLSRESNFNGLLFNAISPQIDLTQLSATGRREFRHLLNSQNQLLVGLQLDLGAKGLGINSDIDRILSHFRLAAETAVDLQSPLLCIDLGALPQPIAPPKSASTISSEQAGLLLIPAPKTSPNVETPIAQFDSALASHVDSVLFEIAQICDRTSVMLAFSSTLASFAALDRAMRAAHCSWFGIDLDPVSMLADAWSIDEVFSALGSQIKHVRARDALVGADRRTKPTIIGKGNVPWPELLAALNAADYKGFLTIDATELPDRRAAALAGAKYLRGLSDSSDSFPRR